MRPPTSFLAVGDLLEETILRSANNQNGADAELAWLRKRLDNERRDPRSRGNLDLENDNPSSSGGNGKQQQQQQTRSVPAKKAAVAGKENAIAAAEQPARANKASPSCMSVLQLRRLLRAVGQPTAGMKPTLAARLENAVSSGAVKAFVDRAKTEPRAAVKCVAERRKTEIVLAMAESMLNLGSGDAVSFNEATAPKPPLRDSLSSANNERSSRSSTGSNAAADKAKPLLPPPATPVSSKAPLSGQQQDAVVAKIRSAAKRSASPEKKLPYQDDDTPNTKGARLKKEMEDRLARQKAAKKQHQQPAPSIPSAEAEALPTPVTPPSL
ncbi:unnamed protein product, partial [Scytosiphon promiscuus]